MQGWLTNSKNTFYKIVLWSVYQFFAIVYRHKIYGLENVVDGPALLAANHASLYDPPLLAISTPYEVHFMAKKALFDIPLFRTLIRRLNAHPVSGKAQDIGVFKTMIRLLQERKKVIIFPEGHRSLTGELQPMKPGIALLLAKSQAALIPVYLHGTFAIWPKHQKWPRLRGRTACVFGKPLYFAKDVAQEEVTATLEKAIRDLMTNYTCKYKCIEK